MKLMNVLRARNLILVTLGTANLFLFQNCSDYGANIEMSSPKGLRSNKDLQAVAENSVALNEIAAEMSSDPNPPADDSVVVQIDEPVVDTTEVVEPPHVAENASAVPAASFVNESSPEEAALDSAPPSESSPEVTSSEPKVDKSSEVQTLETSSKDLNSEKTDEPKSSKEEEDKKEIRNLVKNDDDNDDDHDKESDHKEEARHEDKEDSDHQSREIANKDDDDKEGKELSDFCSKQAKAGEKAFGIKKIELDESFEGKSLRVRGNVVVVNKCGKHIRLKSLDLGGTSQVCGDISVENLRSGGNLHLTGVDIDDLDAHGKVTTSKPGANGEVTVETRTGNEVKSCKRDGKTDSSSKKSKHH